MDYCFIQIWPDTGVAGSELSTGMTIFVVAVKPLAVIPPVFVWSTPPTLIGASHPGSPVLH
ncbi:MAG: hypothetical protein WCG28_01605, partial [bacterium]